jgi:hypothetical protein
MLHELNLNGAVPVADPSEIFHDLVKTASHGQLLAFFKRAPFFHTGTAKRV